MEVAETTPTKNTDYHFSAKEIFGDLRKKLKFCNYTDSGYDLLTLGGIGAKEKRGLRGVDNESVY